MLTGPPWTLPARLRVRLGGVVAQDPGPAIIPDDLGPIEVVPLSHDHADNLDGAGREFLPGAGTGLTAVLAAVKTTAA